MNSAAMVDTPADIAAAQVHAWLSAFWRALGEGEGDVAALFEEDGYWRDLVAFSWNIVTAEGRSDIAEMARHCAPAAIGLVWASEGPVEDADGVASGWFTFETAAVRGRGVVRVRNGRAWTLFTTIVELKGFEERKGRRRINGTDHKPVQGAAHWPELRAREDAELGRGTQPYCLVIGGGQSGAMLAARLRRLGVETLVVDKRPSPGGAWRSRYESLYLHDPVWFNHLPYLPFPDDWPVFSPAYKMADWIDAYAKVMEINYWGSTECTRAVFNEDEGRWTVTVDREGELVTLRPEHIVLATGLQGTPRIPKIEGADAFEGGQYHASQKFDLDAFTGKKCVIVGANSSAHDLAVALWEKSADVTMIQRSSTIVVRSETLMELGIKQLYSEEMAERGISAAIADDIAASIPYKVFGEMQKAMYRHIRQRDADFYDRLSRVGFKFDFGEDDGGLAMAAVRGQGFYIDVGGSGLIADGKIKLEQCAISSIGKTSIRLVDGRELPADLIVYATGYEPIDIVLEKLFGGEIVRKIGRIWGVGSGTRVDPGPWEGELRAMWKPLAQPKLWIMGGNFAFGRAYSRLLALQIKAHKEGVAGKVYRNQAAS